MTNTTTCPCCQGNCAQQGAWVIETANQTYWDGHYTDSKAFSPKVEDAVLFSRREDADVVINWLLQSYAFAVRATYHLWVNGKHT